MKTRMETTLMIVMAVVYTVRVRRGCVYETTSLGPIFGVSECLFASGILMVLVLLLV